MGEWISKSGLSNKTTAKTPEQLEPLNPEIDLESNRVQLTDRVRNLKLSQLELLAKSFSIKFEDSAEISSVEDRQKRFAEMLAGMIKGIDNKSDMETMETKIFLAEKGVQG